MKRITFILFGLAACSQKDVSPLPEIQSSAFLPAVRTEIDAAYNAARNQAGDAGATGKLCKLLDAYDQADAAAQCYTRASALDPKNFEWHYHLGAVRMAQSRYDEAVTALRAALHIREYAPATLMLAESLLQSGHADESTPLFQRLVSDEPGNAEAWYGLGRAKERQQDLTAAEQCFRRACDHLYTDYGAAHYALASLLQRQNRADLARPHFALAEQHKTDVPPASDSIRSEVRELAGGTNALLRRAAAFEKAGQIEDAMRENLAALRKDPKLLQAHINLISLYGRSHRDDDAEQHYRAALELPGAKADADYNYGVLLFREQKLTEAAQAFRRTIASNPQHAQAHHNLGFVLEQQGKPEAALAEYEDAIASQSDYRLAHFHAGRLLASQRRYPAAIDHLLKTIEPVDDSTPGYLYALSAAYARAGQLQNAVEYGQRAKDKATARGQYDLLESINRDLHAMRARNTQQ